MSELTPELQALAAIVMAAIVWKTYQYLAERSATRPLSWTRRLEVTMMTSQQAAG